MQRFKSKKMKKYPISKEYGMYRYFKTPMSSFTFLCSNLLWKIKRKTKNTKDLKITKIKLKNKVEGYYFEPFPKSERIMLYLHGGGFVFKGYSSFPICERYAKEAGYNVLYVDYRLAPKYKYPLPVEDSYEGYIWLKENEKKLQLNLKSLVIAGDSAGGCLAVDVTRKIIEEKKGHPKLLLLIYPTLDKRGNTKSFENYKDTPMWNSKKSEKMWNLYLGKKEYISPNEREDYEFYPETYIETAEFDALHDEAKEFARILKKCGKKVTVIDSKNTMHGYDIKKCQTTEKMIQKRIKKLKGI